MRTERAAPRYEHVYCGTTWSFVDWIRLRAEKRSAVVNGILTIAREEPPLFLRVSLAYAGFVLGAQSPVVNAEVGRWRDPLFKDRIEALGYHANARRDWITDGFLSWMQGVGTIFLRPLYLMFGTGLLILLVRWLSRRGWLPNGLDVFNPGCDWNGMLREVHPDFAIARTSIFLPQSPHDGGCMGRSGSSRIGCDCRSE